MTIIDTEAIKNIVQKNFNVSSELYERFEDDFGLFRFLTEKLAMECELRSGMDVYDIGCGTGSSSFYLADLVGATGSVVGIDFSSEMLSVAQKKLMDLKYNNLKFRYEDATVLSTESGKKADAVLYNASIFLIPESEKTFNCAFELLKSSGIVGMNYLVGVFDRDVNKTKNAIDLFKQAKDDGKPFAPYGRGIIDVQKLPDILASSGFQSIKQRTYTVEMSIEQFRAFYSIPAQSAALWPKNRYSERLELLDELIRFLKENGITTYFQAWDYCSGKKK
jgi:ubiquinone/menaquinone biosynthesis C-methylase UbiE